MVLCLCANKGQSKIKQGKNKTKSLKSLLVPLTRPVNWAPLSSGSEHKNHTQCEVISYFFTATWHRCHVKLGQCLPLFWGLYKVVKRTRSLFSTGWSKKVSTQLCSSVWFIKTTLTGSVTTFRPSLGRHHYLIHSAPLKMSAIVFSVGLLLNKEPHLIHERL